MTCAVVGSAEAFPSGQLSQVDAARIAAAAQGLGGAEARALGVLYRRSGVGARRSVLLREGSPPEHDVAAFYGAPCSQPDHGPSTRARMQVFERQAGSLAAQAAAGALGEASRLVPGFDRGRITHVITVSCTGFVSPGVDQHLIHALELPRTVARCHLGFMGCHGALNALRVAGAFCSSVPDAAVLVAAVELCTLHFSLAGGPQADVANALFGDGAGAVVCAAAAPQRSDLWRAAAFGSCVFPDSSADMTWRIGDHGFEMGLSARVPDLIRDELRPWLDGWLAQHGVTAGEVRSWALHPGGPRVLSAVEECLGLPADATAESRALLAEVGNISSPTILCLLHRLRRRQAPRPCVALGFGPGLVAEAALWT